MAERAPQHGKITDAGLRSALVAFFVRRLRSNAEAEDLAHDVFLRVEQAGAGAETSTAYVFRIAANLLVDRSRREAVRRRHRDDRLHDPSIGIDPIDPHRVAAGRADLARLGRAIGGLPEKTRRIFVLYRIEHVEKRAIADSFGLSLRMVEIHIRRALVALAAAMDDQA